uniref:fructose-bisphosphate aldolase n=1 Tax=Entamoeba histolytica TaxID=5759 RepID=A0A060N1Y8_ENTHI|nr:fructose-1,6-bisphosphate aldolase, putative [Entamoeba histolytica]
MAAKTVNYKELGLCNHKEMFEHAIKGGFAVPGFNFNNLEQMQAIIQACTEAKSPVILQVSKGAREYANATLLRNLAKGAVEYSKEIDPEHKGVPISLNLNHGANFQICKECVDNGFSNVMIDGSALPYEENVKLTKQVVEYAHKFGVTVEGELGVLSGVEDDVAAAEHVFTDPKDVEAFVKDTGVDALAISIGTSHGAYKFKPGMHPRIRLDILHEVEKRIPGFPIVLHGSSSVPQEWVAVINQYGGKLESAIGIPEDQIREAVKSAVCKVNIDSDGRLAMTGSIRRYLAEHPKDFDPRQYLGPARQALKELYLHKVSDKVLNSAGKSWY